MKLRDNQIEAVARALCVYYGWGQPDEIRGHLPFWTIYVGAAKAALAAMEGAAEPQEHIGPPMIPPSGPDHEVLESDSRIAGDVATSV